MPLGKNNGGSSSIKGCELGDSEGGGGAGDSSPLAGWVTPLSNPLSCSSDDTVIVTSATVEGGGGEGEVIWMLEGKLAVGSDSGVVGVAV